MKPETFINDIPKDYLLKGSLAIDTEAMGLNYAHRDRLCVVQICDEEGRVCLVHFKDQNFDAPNLKALLNDASRLKIFHYARFDVGIIKQYLGVSCAPVYCTKIASRLSRTYTDKHGLKELVREIIEIDISKTQQTSNWGADELSQEQIKYAAGDVIYLHQIMTELNIRLDKENRTDLARRAFEAIMINVDLDIAGWQDVNIFTY